MRQSHIRVKLTYDTRCYFNVHAFETRKPTRVSLICRTETTTKKCKTEKLKSKKTDRLRSNSKSLRNRIVSPEKEKERLQWEGFAEKGGFKSGMKERVGDGKLIIIISMTVSGINEYLSSARFVLIRPSSSAMMSGLRAVAPPGLCNRGEVRYGSIGGLEYEVPQSRPYCLCINVALCSTSCNVFVV